MSAISQKQMRQMKLIAEMKKGNYPNSQSMARILRQSEGDAGEPLGCSERTIMRDIKDLQEEYNAPIAYDATNKGYYLENTAWEFRCPVFHKDFVTMSLIGTRLAEDIAPEPLKGDIRDAVTQTLTTNSSEFFDMAMIDSLLCASGVKATIDAAVFKVVFDAWRYKQAVRLKYRSPQGKEEEYDFEPHIIAFNKGLWYLKGYTFQTKELRIYACQRILEARSLARSFALDKRLVEETRTKGLFNYPKVAGIKLQCDASIAFYIHEQQRLFKSKITPQPDGSLVLELNPTVEHEVIRWVLAEAGRIQVLAPRSLREKIAAAGREIAARNA